MSVQLFDFGSLPEYLYKQQTNHLCVRVYIDQTYLHNLIMRRIPV
nr:MAG TPA: hypothetical protein [Caudoviricetes sp.]